MFIGYTGTETEADSELVEEEVDGAAVRKGFEKDEVDVGVDDDAGKEENEEKMLCSLPLLMRSEELSLLSAKI